MQLQVLGPVTLHVPTHETSRRYCCLSHDLCLFTCSVAFNCFFFVKSTSVFDTLNID